jgi:hypothetical protein
MTLLFSLTTLSTIININSVSTTGIQPLQKAINN